MASHMELLPDDVLLDVISNLEVKSILILRMVSHRLEQITRLRVAWIRAYQSSYLPLTNPPDEGQDVSPFDYERQLIRATKLHDNWTAAYPKPCHIQTLSEHPSSKIWLFKSRFLLTVAGNHSVCWDLQQCPLIGQAKLAWGETFQFRPSVIEAAEARRGESNGVLLAYASQYPKGCALLYSKFGDDGELGSPKILPFIVTTQEVKAIGISDADVALACLDGNLILHNFSTGTRRSFPLTEGTVPIWIDTIRIFDEFVLVSRHSTRSIVLEVYVISTNTQTANSLVLQHASEQLVHAQTASISHCKKLHTSAGDPVYIFHVMASFPDSIGLVELHVTMDGASGAPLLSFDFVVDDLSNKAAPSRERSQSLAPNPATDDAYDSDSTSNRISHTNQVIDLVLGASGKRAIVIPISSRTNERAVWGYSRLENGQLLRRPWDFMTFMSVSPSKEASESVGPPNTTTTGAELNGLLRQHACRAVFDEETGRVVVAADCQLISIFDFGE